MTDILIIAVLAVLLFLVVHREVRRIGKGQCSCGCCGCAKSGKCTGEKKEPGTE